MYQRGGTAFTSLWLMEFLCNRNTEKNLICIQGDGDVGGAEACAGAGAVGTHWTSNGLATDETATPYMIKESAIADPGAFILMNFHNKQYYCLGV